MLTVLTTENGKKKILKELERKGEASRKRMSWRVFREYQTVGS